MLQVDAVVDDVQLRGRDAEIAADLVAHHARIADHRAQPAVLERALARAADVAMIGIESDAEALERPCRGAAQLEPAPVHAVPGAIDVAARNALVRLHHVEGFAAPGSARRAGERPVAPQVADMERIDAQHAPRSPARGAARDEGDFGAGALQRRQGARDEALGAAIGVIALADDGQFQFEKSSSAAAWTRSTASVARQSLTFPPPQPSSPQGRQECALVTTRCATRHGPHSCSPLGPNSATVGVPMAAARCIGIESTPTNSPARAVSAPSSLMESFPARLRGFPFLFPPISSISDNSSASGAAVTTP